jgi:2-methylcitrate dehydratase PrpD
MLPETGGIHMEIAHELCEYVNDLDFQDLPEEVIDCTKKVILDTVASAVAGSSAPGIETLTGVMREWGGRPESSIIVLGDKVPAPNAVLINATMARARDIDEVHEKAVLHSAITVVPPCLALAEWVGGIDGRNFIAAVAGGVDIIARLGLSLEASPNITGISSTWQMGTFGAAAATGKLLRLNPEQMINALGIAYSQAAGNQQCIIEGTLMVRVQQGFTAQSGLLSAILAKRGIDGPREVFQGRFGYFPVYHGNNYDASRITRDLGKIFEITNSSLKPYPCCKAIHSAISCVRTMTREHEIDPRDVDSIRVRVNQAAYNLTCHPLESKRRPSSIPEAQFSTPYVVAVALLRGDVFLQDFTAEAITNGDVLSLAQKVTPIVDQAIEDRYGREIGPVGVDVITKDRKTYEARMEFVKGHPRNPMTMEEVEEKLRKCAAFSAKPLPERNLVRVIELIKRMEESRDVSKVMECLQ